MGGYAVVTSQAVLGELQRFIIILYEVMIELVLMLTVAEPPMVRPFKPGIVTAILPRTGCLLAQEQAIVLVPVVWSV